ncbi:anaerobic ribonucleoside-triphosphate reductase activating protein [Candidatus Pacearchaeota archaeon]|nr:MAG: anaerobic ribonucleoside-triphosphate reductase activating protein [Candidatus Pacearchaeota archaeon]
MKLYAIVEGSLVDGPGLRTTIFFKGCEHNCLGCFNPDTQPDIGPYVSPAEVFEKIKKIIDSSLLEITGISLSGGDPLFQPEDELVEFLKQFKSTYPKMTVWCWTGYLFNEIKNNKALNYIDVLIDGRYEQDNKTTKQYRGSDNQKMYKRRGEKWEMID